MIGCYVLTNKENGKKYVGQSSCVESRLSQHHGFKCMELV